MVKSAILEANVSLMNENPISMFLIISRLKLLPWFLITLKYQRETASVHKK